MAEEFALPPTDPTIAAANEAIDAAFKAMIDARENEEIARDAFVKACEQYIAVRKQWGR